MCRKLDNMGDSGGDLTLWAIVEEFGYMWRNLGVRGGDCVRIWAYVEEIGYYGRL